MSAVNSYSGWFLESANGSMKPKLTPQPLHAGSQQRGGGSGGDYYWTKLSYLGQRVCCPWRCRSFHQSHISETQLADYLDTKPKNLAGIEDYFARGNS